MSTRAQSKDIDLSDPRWDSLGVRMNRKSSIDAAEAVHNSSAVALNLKADSTSSTVIPLMAEFHTYFRMEYKQIYELADKYEEEGLTLQQFLRHAESLHQRELP